MSDEAPDITALIRLYRRARATGPTKPPNLVALLLAMLSLASTGQAMEVWVAVRHPPGFLFLSPQSLVFPQLILSNCSLQLPCNPTFVPTSITLTVSLTPPPQTLSYL